MRELPPGNEPPDVPPPKEWEVNLSFPLFYNSNAEQLPSGGTQTLEYNPDVSLSWEHHLQGTNLTVLGTADVNSDHFAHSVNADLDTTYAELELRYDRNPDDRYELKPFVRYRLTFDFSPVFGIRQDTLNDISIGALKRWRLRDGDHPLIASVEFYAQRRFKDSRQPTPDTYVSPSSYALVASPGLGYGIGGGWTAEARVQVVGRLFDAKQSFVRRDLDVSPVLKLKYLPTASQLKGTSLADIYDRVLGGPELTFQVATYQQVSNRTNSRFSQWQVGPSVNCSWL
ncbi:MAG: hypothetical protein JO157_02020, partial [Acetobacteraceae bacterium]|nr:hypothetical protein [Acetobacteraceae bacterium]